MPDPTPAAPADVIRAKSRCDGCAAPWREEYDGGHWCDTCLVPKLRAALASLLAERDEAYRRVGAADAQRMVALRKNDERVRELEALERLCATQKEALALANQTSGHMFRRARRAEVALEAIANSRPKFKLGTTPYEEVREIARAALRLNGSAEPE
jgi:chorismate mutase